MDIPQKQGKNVCILSSYVREFSQFILFVIFTFHSNTIVLFFDIILRLDAMHACAKLQFIIYISSKKKR